MAQILNGQCASWELPSSVRFGDSGAPTVFEKHTDVSANDRTIVAVADEGIDCFTKDIRKSVDTHLVHQQRHDQTPVGGGRRLGKWSAIAGTESNAFADRLGPGHEICFSRRRPTSN